MIELVKSGVVFNEENHTYFLGDKQLSGITGMIKRQLFPDKYKEQRFIMTASLQTLQDLSLKARRQSVIL